MNLDFFIQRYFHISSIGLSVSAGSRLLSTGGVHVCSMCAHWLLLASSDVNHSDMNEWLLNLAQFLPRIFILFYYLLLFTKIPLSRNCDFFMKTENKLNGLL